MLTVSEAEWSKPRNKMLFSTKTLVAGAPTSCESNLGVPPTFCVGQMRCVLGTSAGVRWWAEEGSFTAAEGWECLEPSAAMCPDSKLSFLAATKQSSGLDF